MPLHTMRQWSDPSGISGKGADGRANSLAVRGMVWLPRLYLCPGKINNTVRQLHLRLFIFIAS